MAKSEEFLSLPATSPFNIELHLEEEKKNPNASLGKNDPDFKYRSPDAPCLTADLDDALAYDGIPTNGARTQMFRGTSDLLMRKTNGGKLEQLWISHCLRKSCAATCTIIWASDKYMRIKGVEDLPNGKRQTLDRCIDPYQQERLQVRGVLQEDAPDILKEMAYEALRRKCQRLKRNRGILENNVSRP